MHIYMTLVIIYLGHKAKYFSPFLSWQDFKVVLYLWHWEDIDWMPCPQLGSFSTPLTSNSLQDIFRKVLSFINENLNRNINIVYIRKISVQFHPTFFWDVYVNITWVNFKFEVWKWEAWNFAYRSLWWYLFGFILPSEQVHFKL